MIRLLAVVAVAVLAVLILCACPGAAVLGESPSMPLQRSYGMQMLGFADADHTGPQGNRSASVSRITTSGYAVGHVMAVGEDLEVTAGVSRQDLDEVRVQ